MQPQRRRLPRAERERERHKEKERHKEIVEPKGGTKNECDCCNYVRHTVRVLQELSCLQCLGICCRQTERQEDRHRGRQIDMQFSQLCRGTRTKAAQELEPRLELSMHWAWPCRAELMFPFSNRPSVCLVCRFFCFACHSVVHISCLLCPGITCTFAYYNLHKFARATEWVRQG